MATCPWLRFRYDLDVFELCGCTWLLTRMPVLFALLMMVWREATGGGANKRKPSRQAADLLTVAHERVGAAGEPGHLRGDAEPDVRELDVRPPRRVDVEDVLLKQLAVRHRRAAPRPRRPRPRVHHLPERGLDLS